MKNILKKLHIMSHHSEEAEGSNSSRRSKSGDASSPDDKPLHPRSHEQKPLSGLSNWLNSVANRKGSSPSSSSNVIRGERMEVESYDSIGSGSYDAARPDLESTNSRDPDIEEEYQIQMALELSAREDPEAVQIEAVKQLSLGSCAAENTPAEVIAYRYWNYNALSYDDKILDGFYDLYGIVTESTSERMPSLVDLQGTSVSDGVNWEAVLVNRAADTNLLELEQKAMEIAIKSRSEPLVSIDSELVQKLAILVSNYMGGSVGDPRNMSKAWLSLSNSLRATLGSMVLPLGSLTIGLARHRALLFKVLADSVGIPCRLVKGRQYTGADDVAMNSVKIDDGREYIVDLMADPGTLIPSDAAGSHREYHDSDYSASPLSRETDSCNIASSSSGVGTSFEEPSDFGTLDKRSRFMSIPAAGNQSDEYINLSSATTDEDESKMSSNDAGKFSNLEKVPVWGPRGRPSHAHMHARSPSWTEGVGFPAARRMNANDISRYMIDAAKENPELAQKLHDVLLESGVPSLFTGICSNQLNVTSAEAQFPAEDKVENKQTSDNQKYMKNQDELDHAKLLPPLPPHRVHSKASPPHNQPEDFKSVEGLGVSHSLELKEVPGQPVSLQPDVTPLQYAKKVPVAAAAAAAAAVVASSMVVAAAKSSTDSNLELPVAAAATATTAAVVATTAAVSKQFEQGARSDRDADGASCEPRGSGDRVSSSHGSGSRENDVLGANSDSERTTDRSAGNDSLKSDVALDDVAEFEIPWEEITMGERIGLGSGPRIIYQFHLLISSSHH
uniref:Uncharacterized protein MANES_14G170100 n=1 Tax=Rhizophora mucronata TaxID=61149 RepID=A0A2P2KNR6_RHIMU